VPWQLSPSFANRLVFPLGKVDIERGLAGEPCRLLITVERVRGLAFDKLGPAGSACQVGNNQRT
jgi:hypothetical protein